MGLAITPTIVGNLFSVDVEVAFSGDYESHCNENRIVIYVVEDNLIYDQVNYTDFYGGVSTISNFHHNSVLRAALTPVAGELVSVENGTHTFTSAVSSNIENMNNVRIVAFLINGQGKTQNVRAAEIGDVQTLEIVN